MGRRLTLEDRIVEIFSSQVEDEAELLRNQKQACDLEAEIAQEWSKPDPDKVAELRELEKQTVRFFEENRDGFGELISRERVPMMVEAVSLKPLITPSDEDTVPEQIVYVTAYGVTREYGGPEEGGWWYDWKTHLLSVPCLYRDHLKVIEQLEQGAVGDANWGDISSVLGGHEVRYYIEYIPGTRVSRVAPRYC